MSIQAVGWALDQELPAGPKLVLVAIANHANHADGYCWLNADTIAQEASCKPRSVYRFVAALMRNGFVRREKKRGADGKQRCNDYWILFNRQDAKWEWGGAIDADSEHDQDDPETHISDDADPQDVVDEISSDLTTEQSLSPGQSDQNDSRQTEKVPPLSSGPGVVTVTHSTIAEPSKTNPEDARARGAPPRSYRPPPPSPPQPVGAIAGRSGELVFVFKPSRGYDAWKARKEAENGRPFNAETWREGRIGWYFPSLFPPEHPPPSGTELATESELNEFAKTG